MALGETLSKVFDVLNKILAFLVIVAYVIFAINANWTFIDNEIVLKIIDGFMYYGPLVICGLVLIEFAIKRNILIQIVVYLLIALVVIFQFFPDTFNTMVGTITDATSALRL